MSCIELGLYNAVVAILFLGLNQARYAIKGKPPFLIQVASLHLRFDI
jgi:hypothetical protein